MQKSIDKIELGEKKIHLMRDKFLAEMSEFNDNFEFPKEKVEEIFSSAVNQFKQVKSKRSSHSGYNK